MIKRTELRCGNKVHISGKEDPNERLVATVGEIHYFGSTLECDFGEGEGEEDCDIDHEDLIPIPLSEQWLIRADQVRKHDKYYSVSIRHETGNSLLLIVQEYPTGGYLVELGKGFGVVCETVHHFQNVIHAISQKELTFKDL